MLLVNFCNLNNYSENLQFVFTSFEATFGMQVSCYKYIVKEVFSNTHKGSVRSQSPKHSLNMGTFY